MEKQSGSEREQSFGTSTPTTVTMQKQKAAATNIDDRSDTQSAKLHRIVEQNYSSQNQSQSQNVQSTQSQPLSGTVDQRKIDDPLANDDLDPSLESWKKADQTRVFSSADLKTQHEELEAQLGQADLKIEKLRRKFRTVKKNNESLSKYIEGELRVWAELIEKQDISESCTSVFREQTTLLRDALTGFQETKDKLKEMHDNGILKQYEKIKRMNEQLNDDISKEEKELEERVTLKVNELLNGRIKYNQLENQMTEFVHVINKMEGKREGLEKIIHANCQKHAEKMKKLLDTLKDIEAKLNKAREEKPQLLARRDESLKKLEKLVTEHETQQVSSIENEKQVECLKFNVQEMKKERENLNSIIDQLQNTHLAVISEKDLESADWRKQLQDLKLEYMETMNKSNEINLSNEKLSDDIAKMVQCNGEFKKSLVNKDDELVKLREDLNNALEKNKELSTQSESLNEKLIARKKLLLETRVNLKNRDAKESGSRKREFELNTRLAGANQELKNTIDDVAEACNKLSNEKLRFSEDMKKFKHDFEQKDKEITELRQMRKNFQKEQERIEIENNRKLQQITHLSTQCQRPGHEKRIKEQNLKMENLHRQISAEKLKAKQGNTKKVDSKEKEKREAHLKEMKSNIEDLEKVISATKEQQEGLRKTLKKVQALSEAKSTIVEESLNSSELVGITFAKHQSIPTSSTPKHSPLQGERIHFEFSSSDISSINGSDIFEDAERRYADFLLNNKSENAKLNQSHKRDKS